MQGHVRTFKVLPPLHLLRVIKILLTKSMLLQWPAQLPTPVYASSNRQYEILFFWGQFFYFINELQTTGLKFFCGLPIVIAIVLFVLLFADTPTHTYTHKQTLKMKAGKTFICDLMEKKTISQLLPLLSAQWKLKDAARPAVTWQPNKEQGGVGRQRRFRL